MSRPTARPLAHYSPSSKVPAIANNFIRTVPPTSPCIRICMSFRQCSIPSSMVICVQVQVPGLSVLLLSIMHHKWARHDRESNRHGEVVRLPVQLHPCMYSADHASRPPAAPSTILKCSIMEFLRTDHHYHFNCGRQCFRPSGLDPPAFETGWTPTASQNMFAASRLQCMRLRESIHGAVASKADRSESSHWYGRGPPDNYASTSTV